MKRVITDEVVAQAFASGQRRIRAPHAEAVITPSAWTRARELGVSFDQVLDPGAVRGATDPSSAPAHADPGSAERVRDASGVTVVRGRSVRLGTFTGAGPEHHIGLVDLIGAEQGSPMTAGIMSWSREDSFPWSLDYDEIDLVLEGVLHIVIDGRTIEGKAGDVLYIPKGSRITFATPHRTRVFYVTYPADWTAAAAAPQRPQK